MQGGGNKKLKEDLAAADKNKLNGEKAVEKTD
jgi:hypothetical protein